MEEAGDKTVSLLYSLQHSGFGKSPSRALATFEEQLMDSLAILIMLIWVSLMIPWFLKHDRKPDGKTGGIFAMTEPDGGVRAAGRPARQSRGRRGIAPQRGRSAAAVAAHPPGLPANAAAPGTISSFHPGQP